MQSTSRGVSLRPIIDDDLPFLFRLFADPGRCHLWMHCRRVYDEAGFRQAWSAWAAETMAGKFIIELAGRPVGLVFDHDRTLEDGCTQVTALLDVARTGHGVGIVGAALLVDWLFQTVPLRKVYMKVYAFNAAVVRILRKVGFAEEGVLKEERYWDGRYWDMHIFALHRADWPEVRDRLLRPAVRPARRRPAAAGTVNGTGGRARAAGCLSATE
jgi:RimJ/RimL family protein N-acetyltransferase